MKIVARERFVFCQPKTIPARPQPSHIFRYLRTIITLEELLDVFGFAGEGKASELDERVLLDEILPFQAHLKLFRLGVED